MFLFFLNDHFRCLTYNLSFFFGQWFLCKLAFKSYILKDIKPTKIKFGSDEYFKLLQTNDDVQQWLSIGTRCQVVIAGKLYEIEE